jgi:site-specific recombinase XerD
MRDDFEKYLQGLGHSTTTIHGHLSALGYLTTWAIKENLETDELSYTELLSFTKYCQGKGAGKTTMNKYLLSIRHYFNHLIGQGKATENPAQYLQLKGVARNKLYDIFTPLELESIYNRFCGKDFSSKRYSNLKKLHGLEHLRNKVIVGMLVYQGLRSDEIIHLRTQDVKLRKGMIEIPEVKNSNGREMKLEACQIMDLHQYMTEGRKEILSQTHQQTENQQPRPAQHLGQTCAATEHHRAKVKKFETDPRKRDHQVAETLQPAAGSILGRPQVDQQHGEVFTKRDGGIARGDQQVPPTWVDENWRSQFASSNL